MPVPDAPVAASLSASPIPSASATLPPALAHAVGGVANIAATSSHPGRWRVELRDPALADGETLRGAGVVVRLAGNVVHILADRL